MIKIFSDKKGTIFVEEIFLKNSIEELMKNYFSKEGFIKVTIQIQKASVENLAIHFDKIANINRSEEISLSHEIQFVLLNKFNIDNLKTIFVYENRN